MYHPLSHGLTSSQGATLHRKLPGRFFHTLKGSSAIPNRRARDERKEGAMARINPLVTRHGSLQQEWFNQQKGFDALPELLLRSHTETGSRRHCNFRQVRTLPRKHKSKAPERELATDPPTNLKNKLWEIGASPLGFNYPASQCWRRFNRATAEL